jgi:hypothetical protein
MTLCPSSNARQITGTAPSAQKLTTSMRAHFRPSSPPNSLKLFTSQSRILVVRKIIFQHAPNLRDNTSIASAWRAVVRCSTARGRCVSSVEHSASGVSFDLSRGHPCRPSSALPNAAMQGQPRRGACPGTGAEHPQPARRRRHQRQRGEMDPLVRGRRITMRGDADDFASDTLPVAPAMAWPTSRGSSASPALHLTRAHEHPRRFPPA